MSNESIIGHLSQLSIQQRIAILQRYGTFDKFVRQYKIQECDFKFPTDFFVGANCVTISQSDISVKEKLGYVNLITSIQKPPLKIGLNSYLNIDVLKSFLKELELKDSESYALLKAKYLSSEDGKPIPTKILHQNYGVSGDISKAICRLKYIVGKNLPYLNVTFDHNSPNNPNYELFQNAKAAYLNSEDIFNPEYIISGIPYTIEAVNPIPTIDNVAALRSNKNIYELSTYLRNIPRFSFDEIDRIMDNVVEQYPEYARGSVFIIANHTIRTRLLNKGIHTLDELARRYNDRNSVFGKIKRFRSFLLATNT